MEKYSILQYNLGKYEPFREPLCEIPSNCEYVYVTDDNSIKSSKIKIVYFRRKDKSLLEDCSYIKYHLFDFVNADVCFYIDSCKQMTKPIDPIVERFISNNCDIAVNIHGSRHNLIEELILWNKYRNIPKDAILKEAKFMESLGYDFNYKSMFQGTSRIETKKQIVQEAMDLVHSAKCLVSDIDRFERVDQVLYSFVLNKYYSDKLNVLAYSSRLHNSKYFRNLIHGTNTISEDRDFNDPYLDEGFVFDKLTKLEQFQDL